MLPVMFNNTQGAIFGCAIDNDVLDISAISLCQNTLNRALQVLFRLVGDGDDAEFSRHAHSSLHVLLQ